MFTNKNIIDTCIEEEFRHHSINYVRHLKDKIYLHDNEILAKIDNEGIHIVKSKVDEANQWRLQSTIHLLISTIIEHDLKLNFYVVINLSDGCPYHEQYTRLSTVGRHKDSNHIGIPDSLSWSYLQKNTLKTTLKDHDIHFSEKRNKIVFRGADTGKLRTSFTNQRIDFCKKYHNDDVIDSKITQFVGYNNGLLQECGVDQNDIQGQQIPISEQLLYKYILYIYGNSVSTDRMLWNLACNSLLIELEPLPEEHDYIWYHGFLIQNNILVTIPEINFKETLIDYITNKRESLLDTNNKQKELGKILLQPDIYKEYTKNVLTKYNQIYNNL